MTTILGYCLAVAGIVMLVAGYFRKSRNLIVAGTIAVVLGVGWKDLVQGVVSGWKAAR
jgi:hypothetical protein